MNTSPDGVGELLRIRHHDFVVLELLVRHMITTDEFEDRWVEHDDDTGLHALYLQIYNLYDDGVRWFPTLTSIEYSVQRKILMMSWFLLSDARYEWPPFPDWYGFSLKDRLFHRRGVRKILDEQWEVFRAFGDIRFWPFMKRPAVRSFHMTRGRWQDFRCTYRGRDKTDKQA